jgi:G protein-coupled receptor 158
MKTWRVSLTYRVKSAHKVKLTDKQLLQWMVPILLVMGIYLGTWTAAEPPTATEVIKSYDSHAPHQFNLLFPSESSYIR